MTVAQPGWHLWDMMAATTNLHSFNPTALFFQIGGNDISSFAPEVLACHIIDCAQHLVQASGAKRAFIGQLLYRSQSNFLPSAEAVLEYNHRVDIANRVLKVLAADSSVVRFWRHKGLMEPSVPILCSDGTHFNHTGLDRYFRSIKGSILHTLAL